MSVDTLTSWVVKYEPTHIVKWDPPQLKYHVDSSHKYPLWYSDLVGLTFRSSRDEATAILSGLVLSIDPSKELII